MNKKSSDFQVPGYSIAERKADGINQVTTVILDGEMVEFMIPVIVARAASDIANPSELANE